jgi:hypothetical protein
MTEERKTNNPQRGLEFNPNVVGIWREITEWDKVPRPAIVGYRDPVDRTMLVLEFRHKVPPDVTGKFTHYLILPQFPHTPGPCPFCLSSDLSSETYVTHDKERYQVKCRSCGAAGSWRYSEEEAVRIWDALRGSDQGENDE